VTFWDAGELIAAAQGFGIPHPPGTPLYVALGRAWVLLLSPVAGAARAMNLLSATSTAAAGGLTAWLVARETRAADGAAWGALAGALCAGTMATAWANATETEVYAVALLHSVVLLACAARAGNSGGRAEDGWLLCTAYLIALAPAVHLSALVGAPAAIALAARRSDGRWRARQLLVLFGSLLCAAGVGRVSPVLVVVGVVMMASAARTRGAVSPTRAVMLAALPALAASALLVMLVRARHDPALNQGNPSTFAALADVVARRQYDVASLLPRQAPPWLQLANVAQYADWQVALGWGHGIFTTLARVLCTTLFAAIAAFGARALRRDDRRLADALLVLLACGTVGVAGYLNLKAGTSLGWGVLPDSAPHEARERDYFFVLGFWAWGCLAGYGALALVRWRRWPAPVSLGILLVPLFGNWAVSDRSREPRASAAAIVGRALLASAPPHAVLFTAGDNDSYPLWYVQQVEGQRPDVTLVTLTLLPAQWYQAELGRRTALRWQQEEARPAQWLHEQVAGRMAAAATRAGRPVAATPALTAGERALLGSAWRLEGVVYRAEAAASGVVEPATVDSVSTRAWASRAPPFPLAASALVDDATPALLALLACPRLGQPWRGRAADRDSLEVKCNLR
jgi:hypothetical protein